MNSSILDLGGHESSADALKTATADAALNVMHESRTELEDELQMKCVQMKRRILAVSIMCNPVSSGQISRQEYRLNNTVRINFWLHLK